MRREIKVVVAAAMAALSFAVPGAGAATPQEICRDFVDNGRLDGTYTQSELEAFLRDPTVQGYCPAPALTPPPPKKKDSTKKNSTPTKTSNAPTSGVAGATSPVLSTSKSAPLAQPAAATPPQRLTETAQAQTLPFTGAELGLFAIVGASLLLGGFALRASSRHR